MRICNVVSAWNQWSVFRNLDENHVFFHSFVRGRWAYGKNAILELECAFYLTFGTFLEVCIRFFFTFAISSCVKPAGIIVQVQEICWTVTKRIDSSCSVRCHALHDCHQTWSFQQAPSSKLINMRCGWALPSQCVGSTQLGFRSGHLWLSCVIAAENFNDVQLQRCHYTPPHPTHPPQPHALRSIQHVCNFNDVITPHPTHPPQPHVLRSIQHVCNFNDVITPHPTHPPQPHMSRSIQHVCNFNDVITPHPTHPPQPHMLRSIQHVCNFNDVITPRPTHPPQPHVLRSIQHVCNFNDVFTPHPTPPTQPNPRDRREGKCIDPTVYSGRSTFRNASLRPTGAKNKQTRAQKPLNTAHLS